LQYIFENYSLDADRRELRRGADLVTVEPQVFDVLQYLVRYRDRIVSKDDLIAGVWEGRIVSESTLSSRITAVRHAIGDSGKRQRLIRTVPRKGFRFIGAVRQGEEQVNQGIADSVRPAAQEESTRPSLEVMALPLPDKPSIAVLPFANISGDAEQDYFVDGIIEDITSALSQFRWLFVIARSSSFTYKGRAVDVRRVGRELGVRYVLEGSVRKSGDRVRIAGQLIDTSTGVHLWADRFDGALEEVFDLQDQVTARVVGAIAPKLEQAEIERAKRKPTESLDAYDYYLRGMGSVYQWTASGINEALRLFHKAIRIDPEFASAHGMAARCYAWRKANGCMAEVQDIDECARLARRAAELGKDDAVALYLAGHAIARVVGDLDAGAALIDRALALNPNLSVGWYVSGWVRIFLGQPDVAIEHLTRAIRLSPLDPLIFRVHAAIAHAHFFAGRYDDASASAEKAVHARPNYLTAVRGAAASYALAGRLDQAQNLVMRMRELNSALRISNLKDLFPLRRPEDFTKWVDGLRKAGLPE
jgi:TolB-like protein